MNTAPFRPAAPVSVAGAAGAEAGCHGPRPRIAPLLDVDADLGRLLDEDRLQAARRAVAVRLVAVHRGVWNIAGLVEADGRHLGLLVVDGLLGREVLADDVASLELVGPGDLVRPWSEPSEVGLVSAKVRWSALAETRMALLDRRVAERLAGYPEIHAMLLERLAMRARRLAVTQAISQLNRVDRRLLLLMWHLAERWGRVTPDGVALPLTLSHRLLAQLVGARRPTVSTALGELTREGRIARRSDGTWLLREPPAGTPDRTNARFVAPRRATLGTLAAAG